MPEIQDFRRLANFHLKCVQVTVIPDIRWHCSHNSYLFLELVPIMEHRKMVA